MPSAFSFFLILNCRNANITLNFNCFVDICVFIKLITDEAKTSIFNTSRYCFDKSISTNNKKENHHKKDCYYPCYHRTASSKTRSWYRSGPDALGLSLSLL